MPKIRPSCLNTFPARPKTRPGRAESDLPLTVAVKVRLATIKGYRPQPVLHNRVSVICWSDGQAGNGRAHQANLLFLCLQVI